MHAARVRDHVGVFLGFEVAGETPGWYKVGWVGVEVLFAVAVEEEGEEGEEESAEGDADGEAGFGGGG